MLKPLKYFLTAMVLFAVAKLIGDFFYKDPYSHESKKTHDPREEVVEKSNQEIKKEVAASQESPQDSSANQSTTFDAELDKSDANKIASQVPETAQNALKGEDYFQNLKNSYLSPIVAELPEGRSREDVVVRYYKHNMDNNKVYALRSLGYYLHEKEPEDSKDLESNVLYYGRDVDVRDIQLVAYTLLKSGVPLRSIKQSQFDWKSTALEIGTDSLIQENPLLTIATIESFRK